MRGRASPSKGDPTEEATDRCPECRGSVVDDGDRGERVCRDCGLVVSSTVVDTGPEWRAFDPEDRAEKSRVGAPVTRRLHDKGLSTSIGWADEDAYGRPLGTRKRKRMARLRTWDERFRTRDGRDRNLKHALSEIDRMAAAVGVPTPVRETAGVIYRRALDEDLLPGRSIEGMATAVLYAAARMEGVPRTFDELTPVSRVDRMEIQRAYRYLARELDLQLLPPDPNAFLGRFASAVGCTNETERLAADLIRTATDRGLHSGKDPVGIAASGLYAAAKLTGEAVTQSEVSAVANVSEVTIRNRYREILSVAEETGEA
jgi:transcription initiation factor TFIIB